MAGFAEDQRFEPATADMGASSLVRRLARQADPAFVVQARRRNYGLFGSLLPREAQVLPDIPEGVCPLFFPFLVSDKPAAIHELAAKGVSLYPYWLLPHPAIPTGAFPEADHLRTHLLALPVYQGLSSEDVEYLADAVTAVASSQ